MQVVRALVRGIKSLPEHTLKTNRLSEQAKHVRSVIAQARSPETLLFVDLPAIFSMQPFSQSQNLTNQADAFFEQLSAAFRELVDDMPRLLAWGRDEWLAACGLEKGSEGWSLFCTYATDMMAYTSDSGLIPLLKRATETEDGYAPLESVLAYIASRPPRNWTDADADRFQLQAEMLGKSFQTEWAETTSEIALSPEQRKHSRQLADVLRQRIQQSFADDPKVIKAALQMLMKDLKR
jgi:hypothetical protein